MDDGILLYRTEHLADQCACQSGQFKHGGRTMGRTARTQRYRTGQYDFLLRDELLVLSLPALWRSSNARRTLLYNIAGLLLILSSDRGGSDSVVPMKWHDQQVTTDYLAVSHILDANFFHCFIDLTFSTFLFYNLLRRYNHQIQFVTIFVRLNIRSFPQHCLRMKRYARRYANYPETYSSWTILSSVIYKIIIPVIPARP